MEESISPASLAIVAVVCAASFVTLFFLFQRHIGGTPLVNYEPRRRVPWGPGVALLAIAFPLTGIAVTLVGIEHQTDETIAEQTPNLVDDEEVPDLSEANRFIANGLSTSAAMILIVAVVAGYLRISLRADWLDLGIPLDSRQIVADVGLGTIACIASILPTYVIQLVLTLLLQPESEHPMIEEFQVNYTPGMMWVGLFMVVVAAPLFEEFSFRLLFQGWLERWEDETIGFSGSVRKIPIEDAAEGEDLMGDLDVLPLPFQSTTPPERSILPDLPHGWLPILVSSTVFGLAHFGHGVSPIPLVLFGMVLGYMYQRTHRLVPSITAHALFNAYSMTLLWLNL